ncbi:imidazolonepropionase-like amidohydrolase [Actinoalloteichus hoggarensis]|uniref:Imidazolonepropionase n=1 Tax=Actinoalloteichus hoggarensis TaxID=1470176 RepID=A0A221W1V0_9PSEU|nr:amidohydrolase family protein [Actinoalloteichus hoggarensis]ASO19653.1 Imidazolonepropionase [Actinoalloteichus hoggarensis]MBB5919640.1 imidazolonepropionase-like amidohydrolase [Actinoalloteichus hoggarensis]
MTRIHFTGGRVFDGTGSPARPADVTVTDDRIESVNDRPAATDPPGSTAAAPAPGERVVDVSGATVLPGLFDCHTHMMLGGIDTLQTVTTPFSLPFFAAVGNLRTTLSCGITSVRDAGGADLGVAEAVRRGMIPGPRMQIAISMLSQTGGHGDDHLLNGGSLPLMPSHPGKPNTVVDGPEEVRKKVRELIRAGADVIKVATSGGVASPRDDPRHAHFRDDEVAVMVAEATAAGLSVMAHAQGTDGIAVAVRNGVRSVEHGIYLTDEVIELMLEHDTWLVPTLHAPRALLAGAASGAGLTSGVIDKARRVLDQHIESARAAIAAGVRIAMGTDAGVGPHGDNLDELRLLTECGMSVEQALHAATRSAAELLGVADRLGTLEPGRLADLVVLDGDPAALIPLGGEAMRAAVREVWTDGRRVYARTEPSET